MVEERARGGRELGGGERGREFLSRDNAGLCRLIIRVYPQRDERRRADRTAHGDVRDTTAAQCGTTAGARKGWPIVFFGARQSGCSPSAWSIFSRSSVSYPPAVVAPLFFFFPLPRSPPPCPYEIPPSAPRPEFHGPPCSAPHVGSPLTLSRTESHSLKNASYEPAGTCMTAH